MISGQSARMFFRGREAGRAISMSEAIAIEVEVDVDVEGDRHRRQALVTAVGKYLAAHDPDKASHPALLEREEARSWRGIVAYAPREITPCPVGFP